MIDPTRVRCRGGVHRPGCAHLGNDPTRSRCDPRTGAHRPGCDHLLKADLDPLTAVTSPSMARSKRGRLKADLGVKRGQKSPVSRPSRLPVAPEFPPPNWGVSNLFYPANTVHGNGPRPAPLGRVSWLTGRRVYFDTTPWKWRDPCPRCASKTEFGYCSGCTWVCPNEARPRPEP